MVAKWFMRTKSKWSKNKSIYKPRLYRHFYPIITPFESLFIERYSLEKCVVANKSQSKNRRDAFLYCSMKMYNVIHLGIGDGLELIRPFQLEDILAIHHLIIAYYMLLSSN